VLYIRLGFQYVDVQRYDHILNQWFVGDTVSFTSPCVHVSVMIRKSKLNHQTVTCLYSNVVISLCLRMKSTALRDLKELNSVALVRERTMPTERPPLVGEVVPTFADRGCRVVSATDPPGS
jgi:hypothetical protein